MPLRAHSDICRARLTAELRKARNPRYLKARERGGVEPTEPEPTEPAADRAADRAVDTAEPGGADKADRGWGYPMDFPEKAPSSLPVGGGWGYPIDFPEKHPVA